MALNLDVSEALLTNLGYCREAVHLVLVHIRNDGSSSSLLAVSLLDILVINVGYPFQLCVSKSDVLNKLVRFFPSKAPTIPNALISSILTLLSKWNSSFVAYYLRELQDPDSHFRHYCTEFVNIHRVCRILVSCGYIFPIISRDSIRILIPFGDNPLPSKKDYEKELEMIQQYRLADLLQSRNERDLNKANEIIRDITGYEDTDYWKYNTYIRKNLEAIRNRLLHHGHLVAGTEMYREYQTMAERLEKMIESAVDDDFPKPEAISLLDTISSILAIPRPCSRAHVVDDLIDLF